MGARVVFFLICLDMLSSMLNSSEKSDPLLAAMEGIFTLSKMNLTCFFLILSIYGKSIF